ncbi:MAG: dynamin family protein [Desulfococcaceae bacterium]
MDNYTVFTDELLKIAEDTGRLVSKTLDMVGAGDPVFENWLSGCENIRQDIAKGQLRVAVVGAIKSGKSTFVNSLFKDDYLKRGAGVVTSIVTRIRRGDALRATLWFKSWKEVNAEMEKSLLFFPSPDWRTDQNPFDIRREKDRSELAAALDSLNRDLLISNDSRSTDTVVLSSYLKGYEQIKDIVAEEPVTVEYKDKSFAEHKKFTGDDSLAVWLRDIELEISTGDMAPDIEIADCQGSDSPNPLHLVMIQDYLLLTHLIVYVISSRTGLRQADIRFLSSIRRMGIMDNTIFLINFDFGEHDNVNDLERVTAKIKEDIALLRPDPDVYVLSALFNLFTEKEKELHVKDRLRFAHWKGELGLAEYSNRESRRFETAIAQKLSRERYTLLLKNHLERLGVISSGLEHRISLNRDILMRDVSGVGEMLESIGKHQDRTAEIRSMIRSTLDGAVRKIQKTIRTDTDRFFDSRYGIPADAVSFLDQYSVVYSDYVTDLKKSGFNHAMYMIFQEIRRAVDVFMAENVNPEVIRFAREEESKIQEHFMTLSAPYDVMVRDALSEYNRTLDSLGIAPIRESVQEIRLPDMESAKHKSGIHFVQASASVNYTAGIRADAVMRLGFYRIVRFFKKLFKKTVTENEGEIMALRGGVARLKKETAHSLQFSFKDYRENLKFQYFFKLADAVAKEMYECLCSRFDTYAADLSRISETAGEKQTDKDRKAEMLLELEKTRQGTDMRIRELKEKIRTAA